MGGSTQASFVLTGRGDAEQVGGVSTTASLNDVFRVRPIARALVYRGGGSARRAEGRRARLQVLAAPLQRRPVRRRPHADLRRRALRSDRRHAGDASPTASADFYVPLAAQAGSRRRAATTSSRPTRGSKPGVPLDRATTEMRALGQTLASEFGHNHGIDVRSYREVVVGNIRDAAAGAARRGVLRAADRLRQRRQPAAAVGPGAPARAGHPPGARRRAARRRAPADVRGAACCRSPAARSACCSRSGSCGSFVVLAATTCSRAADDLHIDGRVLAFTAASPLSSACVCGLWPLLRLRVCDAHGGAARRGHAHGSGARDVRQRPGRRRDRRSRSRCWSAPG